MTLRMRFPSKTLGWLALACVATVGCNRTVSSVDISTSSIYAELVATAQSDGRTVVLATLRTGSPFSSTFVGLYGGDRLIATEVDPVTLDRLALPMVGYARDRRTNYIQVFVQNEDDLGIEIGLDRGATGGTNAPSSVVALPTPFSLDWVEDTVAMPPAPITFSRSSATPYSVVWSPAGAPAFDPGDVLRFEVTGPCIEAYSGTIDWSMGEDSLPLTGVLADALPPFDGQACVIEVELTLRRSGSVDPAFAGGSFLAEQVRVLTLFALP